MEHRFESPDYYKARPTRGRVGSQIRAYMRAFEPSQETAAERKERYAEIVNQYYDLATDFYEYGWGKSFHFAPRFRGESFAESLARAEHYLALRLGLRPGMKALDVGCGVGGPMRAIARHSGASVDGINNNAYQLEKLAEYNERDGLSAQCRGIKGDFMALDIEDGTYDAAYAIEATCHAPSLAGVYGEVFRVLKPGAYFAAYEWCMTDAYDPNDEKHRSLKLGIETGDGIPNLVPRREVHDALESVGFELIDARDTADDCDPETPWYLPLVGEGFGLTRLRRSGLGRVLSHRALGVMEALRIAPQGTQEVSGMLNLAADSLIEAGRMGIFTPDYFFLVRRPVAS